MTVDIVENKEDNTVTVFYPRCSICGETMVKGFFRYLADPRMTDKVAYLNEVTFNYMNPLVSMLFVCKVHKDVRVEMSYNELGVLAPYLDNQIKFESSPRLKK